ncbi:MAG TPA: DUF4397 domain-containing protein [Terracidiphilus sp.]|nr:DUF4397 domain-containing protein [Terracidiphilus sp.]
MRTSLPERFSRPLTLRALAIAVPVSLALALSLAACEKVATYTQPSLVRFIDASTIAPAVNVQVEGQLIAASAGAGTITPYGTVSASEAALIQITAATGGPALVSTSGTLLPGHQHSVFLTDNGAAPSSYTVTVLEDQQINAAANLAAFRFLNQAPKTGAVDIYMVPSGVALADAIPLVTDLPVGATAGYISFTAQTVTMVVTPTGVTKPAYTSSPITLVGGEARTALIMDAQLTSNPPVQVSMADDAGPAN